MILLLIAAVLLLCLTFIFMSAWKYSQQLEQDLINHRKGPVSSEPSWKDEINNSEGL